MGPYLTERLVILGEECAEIQQVIAKIQRFGLDVFRVKDPIINNREHLAIEIGDLLGVIKLLVEAGVLTEDELIMHAEAKIKKMEKWTKWSPGDVPNPNWKD